MFYPIEHLREALRNQILIIQEPMAIQNIIFIVVV